MICALTVANRLARRCNPAAGLVMPIALFLSPSLAATVIDDNVLLQPWSGAYGGVPPFDKIRVTDFKPAMLAAMAEELSAVNRIASNPLRPTFENTVVPLERSGRTLDRVQRIFGVYQATLDTPDVQAVEQEMTPLLAAHSDQIRHNLPLYRRIAAVYAVREKSALAPEQQRLTWFYYTRFLLSGAQLDSRAKADVSDINRRLAALYTRFSQNVLADENDHWLELSADGDLAGLPPSIREALVTGATARGVKVLGAVLNTRSSVEPFLELSTRRDLRERAWRIFVNRGDNPNAHNNNTTVAEILTLRAKRAHLLGFRTHAHWRLEDTMAKTPERAVALMEKIWPAALARVHEEVSDMQTIADQESAARSEARIRIEPWDYRFYAEKVRKMKYDLDANEVKPYLQLDKLRDGMFWVADQLLGFRFRPVAAGTVPVVHPDIRVFEVTNAGGAHVGLWYWDPYARANKTSGAWMSEYRSHERLDNTVTPIVSNNFNFIKGADGAPVLISWNDAKILFQQFGHALRELCSKVGFRSLDGTDVARDFVEFPAQLIEHWLSTPEVLQRFAVHYQTGQPIPPELVAKIRRAETFNSGFRTVEYLSGALIDMRLHLAGVTAIDPTAFEKEVLESLGMPDEIVMRHRTPQFQHIFASEGFSAGYYSYLWADVLAADAWEAFTEAGGPYDPTVAARLRDNVFSVGNARDAANAYRAFRGRDPGVAALMRQRGFAVPVVPTPKK